VGLSLTINVTLEFCLELVIKFLKLVLLQIFFWYEFEFNFNF